MQHQCKNAKNKYMAQPFYNKPKFNTIVCTNYTTCTYKGRVYNTQCMSITVIDRLNAEIRSCQSELKSLSHRRQLDFLGEGDEDTPMFRHSGERVETVRDHESIMINIIAMLHNWDASNYLKSKESNIMSSHFLVMLKTELHTRIDNTDKLIQLLEILNKHKPSSMKAGIKITKSVILIMAIMVQAFMGDAFNRQRYDLMLTYANRSIIWDNNMTYDRNISTIYTRLKERISSIYFLFFSNHRDLDPFVQSIIQLMHISSRPQTPIHCQVIKKIKNFIGGNDLLGNQVGTSSLIDVNTLRSPQTINFQNLLLVFNIMDDIIGLETECDTMKFKPLLDNIINTTRELCKRTEENISYTPPTKAFCKLIDYVMIISETNFIITDSFQKRLDFILNKIHVIFSEEKAGLNRISTLPWTEHILNTLDEHFPKVKKVQVLNELELLGIFTDEDQDNIADAGQDDTADAAAHQNAMANTEQDIIIPGFGPQTCTLSGIKPTNEIISITLTFDGTRVIAIMVDTNLYSINTMYDWVKLLSTITDDMTPSDEEMEPNTDEDYMLLEEEDAVDQPTNDQ